MKILRLIALAATILPLFSLRRNEVTNSLQLAPVGGNEERMAGKGATYYLDCSAAIDGDGSQQSPWNSSVGHNSHNFGPGDQLLLRRGTSCKGALHPAGSGSSGRPVVIDAYGTGPKPIIDGEDNNAALELTDQSYWTIRNLEVVRGVKFGILIQAKFKSSVGGFTLNNLDVHGATGTAVNRADSAEVAVQTSTTGTGQTVSDVMINGVAAHDSHVSDGIMVNAGDYTSPTAPKGNNVTVQNASAYNVYGDGIFIGELTNGLLQGNIVHDSGLCPRCGGSTPVGLWAWNSTDVVVQNNESYSNHSWGSDGGGFDVDIWNTNQTIQYNYSHDNQSYCIAVLANQDFPTTNSIVRYNICSNNNRGTNPELIKLPGGTGDIDLWTGSGPGAVLNGVQIYNNTSYWNPATPGTSELWGPIAKFAGYTLNFYKNNLVFCTGPQRMIDVTRSVALDYNLYYTTSGSLSWKYEGNGYASLAEYQRGTGQDRHSLNVDPLLNSPTYHDPGVPPNAFTLRSDSPAIDAGTNVCAGVAVCSAGSHDFFKNPIPQGKAFDIGAYEYSRK